MTALLPRELLDAMGHADDATCVTCQAVAAYLAAQPKITREQVAERLHDANDTGIAWADAPAEGRRYQLHLADAILPLLNGEPPCTHEVMSYSGRCAVCGEVDFGDRS